MHQVRAMAWVGSGELWGAGDGGSLFHYMVCAHPTREFRAVGKLFCGLPAGALPGPASDGLFSLYLGLNRQIFSGLVPA
jgi:hypothetical protein